MTTYSSTPEPVVPDTRAQYHRGDSAALGAPTGTGPGADGDVGLLSPVWAGTPIASVVSDRAWLQAMLDAEAALARAQARLGTVPGAAARIITESARARDLDPAALARTAWQSANPVVGLVREFTALVAKRAPEAAEYVHRGSTSQDILDTAIVLVADRALRVIVADLERVAGSLAGLARAHRDTLVAGRTLALHAVPTTFGLKAAGWHQLVLDALDRLSRLLDGGLPAQLGGAAGTLAGYLEQAEHAGPAGFADPAGYAHDLVEAFADELGLAVPLVPWHTLRTPVVDLGTAAAFTTGALGKIAVDVLSLTRTEVAEVHEPSPVGRGASSAMPHKSNPVLSTAIRSAALQTPQLAATLLGCLPSEDERSAGAWHAEWQPLRELLRLTGGAAGQAVELTAQLAVSTDRMRQNAGLTGGQIVSERVAAALTPLVGRAAAKDLLSEASREAARSGEPLAAVLRASHRVREALPEERLTALLDPSGYTGAAGALVDRALLRTVPGTGTAGAGLR
jgi:3-carboxy-cis,cis-muconate cycloisomerase